MMPIVNGLEEEFGARVAFVYLNAQDRAEGERAFELLSLPGHPGYVLFTPDGVEVYRALGIVEDTALRSAVESALRTFETTDVP